MLNMESFSYFRMHAQPALWSRSIYSICSTFAKCNFVV